MSGLRRAGLAGASIVALAAVACEGPLGPPDASLRIRVDIDRLPQELPGEFEDFVLRFEGEVIALSFARQEFTLAGFDTPERALTVQTDQGDTLSFGLDARLDGQTVAPSLDVQVGERVVVTVAKVHPFWHEAALLVEDGDGVVVAGVEGSVVGLPSLEDRLRVRAGSRAQRTFNHPCGRGRALTLDVSADTTVSVPMNASASIVVDSMPVELLNVGSWATEERRGISCEDFAAPFRWVVWR